MAKRDYYEILGVQRTATEAEMKASYRKLAMKWHPDRNPGNKDCETHFKEINEAYDVLKDDQKRAAYDRFGHAAFEQGGPGAAHGFGADFASSFSDIFEDLFSGGRRGRGGGRERGADLRFNMEITLEEAYVGKTAQVRIPTSVTCEACSGNGAKAGSKPKTCATCGGAGKVRHTQGFFTLERTCVACQGRGQVIDNPCPNCSGSVEKACLSCARARPATCMCRSWSRPRKSSRSGRKNCCRNSSSNRRMKPSPKRPDSSPRSRSSLTAWGIGRAQPETGLNLLPRRVP